MKKLKILEDKKSIRLFERFAQLFFDQGFFIEKIVYTTVKKSDGQVKLVYKNEK